MKRMLAALCVSLGCLVSAGSQTSSTTQYPVVLVCECKEFNGMELNSALHNALSRDSELTEAVDTSDSRAQYYVVEVRQGAAPEQSARFPVSVRLVWLSRRSNPARIQCTDTEVCAANIMTIVRRAVKKSYSQQEQ
ncbi:hypothetical protein [Terriglobus tenax]|uniref:hypothetical protein n=1 Tax=Terriglobus tenax TaxID=1111115 RepID=UPI0021E0607B|nr:hypothetical protein [Terriglobus tenax]